MFRAAYKGDYSQLGYLLWPQAMTQRSLLYKATSRNRSKRISEWQIRNTKKVQTTALCPDKAAPVTEKFGKSGIRFGINFERCNFFVSLLCDSTPQIATEIHTKGSCKITFRH